MRRRMAIQDFGVARKEDKPMYFKLLVTQWKTVAKWSIQVVVRTRSDILPPSLIRETTCDTQ